MATHRSHTPDKLVRLQSPLLLGGNKKKKDPYYTYTNYTPCKPVVHKVCWVVPVLVLAAVIAVLYGAALLTILGG